MTITTATARDRVELEKFPKAGDVITLPTGLKYFNQYYGTKHTTSSPRTVTVIGVERDEIFWKIPGDQAPGETCYARWQRRRPS
jgi:hypothetical protein